MLSVTRLGAWCGSQYVPISCYTHIAKSQCGIGRNAKETGGQNELRKQVLMLKEMLIKLWQDGFL